jgi:hypothetical protein
MPHFSLQMTGFPVSPFRNGFGLIGWMVADIVLFFSFAYQYYFQGSVIN